MSSVFLRTSGAVVLSSLAVLCAMAIALAQVSIEPRARPKKIVGSPGEPRADLRVDVPLVMIPVHVTTALGASVRGLKKESFRLFEDGVEQTITHFASDDAPLSAGFLLDASGSMRNKMRKSVSAAGEFLKITNPEDEFFLIRFGERPKLAVPLTRDMEQVRIGLVRARPLGRTSLLDAIHLSLSEMRRAHNLRKAIVILSDGGDNHSRYTETEIKRRCVRPMSRSTPSASSSGMTPRNARLKSATDRVCSPTWPTRPGASSSRSKSSTSFPVFVRASARSFAINTALLFSSECLPGWKVPPRQGGPRRSRQDASVAGAPSCWLLHPTGVGEAASVQLMQS